MKYKNILIIGNGEKPKKQMINKFIKTSDLIVCADGGANHAENLGIIPNLIIGDMDSIFENVKIKFKKIKQIISINQNFTDLEKTISYILKYNPEIINIFGVMGNRIDHSLSNLSLLKKYHDKTDMTMFSNNSQIKFYNSPFQFKSKIGAIISIIPFSEVRNITTSGLKYPLKNETLKFGERDGQSNIATENNIKIEFSSGELFLIHQI